MQTHPTHYPTDLTDDEWNRIKSLVPAPKSGKRGQPVALDRRSLLNAVFYLVRAGCAWRLLPSDFGPIYLCPKPPGGAVRPSLAWLRAFC